MPKWWEDDAPRPFDLLMKSLAAADRPPPDRGAPVRPPPAPPPRQPAKPAVRDPALYRHGDRVAFVHGRVRGVGKLVASTMETVTVMTDDLVEHRMRHSALRRLDEATDC